ncbi:hypothetical protein J53TS2_42350 [Paenibacillus sp. J53TS2]|nr:hypothetical protein J53TS2_42350 [Paenibacillus sp. J53TS2]
MQRAVEQYKKERKLAPSVHACASVDEFDGTSLFYYPDSNVIH